MLQDSVPAGSYNDPFLSSVCVCAYCIGIDSDSWTGHGDVSTQLIQIDC